MRWLALVLMVLATSPAGRSEAPAHYLLVWGMETQGYPGDQKGHDFLATFNIGESNFGSLEAMVPVPTRSQMAHHTNYEIPRNGMLFANDFAAAHSYVFDVRNPRDLRIAASFDNAGPYTHPHSFAMLSNGNELVTYQQKGSDDTAAGALVEVDAKGHMLRSSDAADPNVDPFIRPYSLQVLEDMDRVVTTSADMLPSPHDSSVIQVWRLSDLKLLKTVALPKAPRKVSSVANQDADEARVLADGKTVVVQTSHCGLFRLRGLEGTNPNAEFIYDYGFRSCPGVPIVVGNYWVESSMSAHCITALNMRDPSHPLEASHLMLGPDAVPHWLAREPGGNHIVITGFGSLLNRISFATINEETGALSLDKRAIEMNRKWPDGWSGKAVPHAALFYTR